MWNTRSSLLSFFQQRASLQIMQLKRKYHELSFLDYGNPSEVLEYVKNDCGLLSDSSLQEKALHIQFLYSPINPADLNIIEGRYPDPKTLHFPSRCNVRRVGGGEGIARIVNVDDGIVDAAGEILNVGDFVFPNMPGFGTWRSDAFVSGDEVRKICMPLNQKLNSFHNDNSSDFDDLLMRASTMSVNPCTAYRMTHDFENLSTGDVVVQNGGASSVGIAVSQLLHSRGIKTISIVRKGNRSTQHFDKLQRYLQEIGKATIVIDEKELSPKYLKTLISSISSNEPKLGLNCIGGESATTIAKVLAHSGTLVSYGGMSKLPVTIPTGLLIFRNIKCVGYWQSRYSIENALCKERSEMLSNIGTMILDGTLKTRTRALFELNDFKSAFRKSNTSSAEDDNTLPGKVLFKCSSW